MQASYHDEIQEAARRIEEERGRKYNDKDPAKRIVWTRAQLAFLQAAQYKLARVELFTKEMDKVYDDLIDAYNFVALLYADLKKGERGERQS